MQIVSGRFSFDFNKVTVEYETRIGSTNPLLLPFRKNGSGGFPYSGNNNTSQWIYSIRDQKESNSSVVGPGNPWTIRVVKDGNNYDITLYYNNNQTQIYGYIDNVEYRMNWQRLKEQFVRQQNNSNPDLQITIPLTINPQTSGGSGTSTVPGATQEGSAVFSGMIDLGVSTADNAENCRDRTSGDTYDFQGTSYTLEELQQQCEEGNNRLQQLRIEYQQALYNSRNPGRQIPIQAQIQELQPTVEAICSLVQSIQSGQNGTGTGNGQGVGTSTTDQDDTQSDITPQQAIQDLDDASRRLEFGSSFGTNISPFLSFGRQGFIINRKDYGTQTSQLKERFSLETPLIDDRLKYFFNSFYSLEQDNSLALYRTKSDITYLSLLRAIQQEIITQSVYSPVVREVLTFRTRPININNQNNLQLGLISNSNENDKLLKKQLLLGRSFTGEIKYQNKTEFQFSRFINGPYRDDSFEMTFPFQNTELLENLNIINAFITDIKVKYNFYIKKYEDIAISTNLQSNEKELPNLYVLLNDIFINSNNSSTNEPILIESSYFERYANDYINSRQSNAGFYESLIKKNKNIIFLTDSIANLANLNEKKSTFPMYTDISIPIDKKSNITKMLHNSELINNFIVKLANLFVGNSFVQEEKIISQKMFQQNIVDNTLANPASQIISEFSTERKNTKQYKLSDMMSSIFQEETFGSTMPIVDPENTTIIGNTDEFQNRNNNSMRFINSLRKIIFLGQVKTFLKNNFRNYIDLLNGKKAYNETVAYRIAKYEKNETQDNPIQNFWIPKVDGIDYINIIDTQIKYSKEYKYKIFAYQIVASTHYQQRLLNYQQDYNFDIEVMSKIEPMVMEVEMINFDNLSIREHPPLSPEIEFVPYFGKDNKIGLFLNTRTGEEKLQPISILESDVDKIDTYNKNSRGLVVYKTDDFVKRYEVMKLDKKPRNYTEFRNGYIKLILPNPNIENESNINAGSIIDDIEPNKKYYYCFRTVDVHDNISNPSPVYELEMINENGMIFPIIKNYEFETPKFENSLEMRRFIKIKPQMQHYLINSQDTRLLGSQNAQQALENNFSLGITNFASPWGKTFKMIATSKQTGKKIEIKFKFNYKLE
jgi:hypothetical protein